MMTRVSSAGGSKAMLQSIQASYARLDKAQEQVTSGRRINRVSDDPADAVASIINRSVMKRFEQYERNSAEAESWLLSNDAALSDASSNLAAVRTLIVQAGGGSVDSVARKAIADEIRAIRVSLIGVSNASKGGRPIFAGTATTDRSYADDGTYLGDANPVQIPVLDSIVFRVNRTGPEVFGTNNPTDPTNGDVFQLLDWIATEVEAGNSTNVSSAITMVDNALKRIESSQVDLGTRHAQLETIMSQIESSKVATTTSISKKEDVDAAEAIMNYRTRMTAYEAALQVAAKVLQPSLLDFLA